MILLKNGKLMRVILMKLRNFLTEKISLRIRTIEEIMIN